MKNKWYGWRVSIAARKWEKWVGSGNLASSVETVAPFPVEYQIVVPLFIEKSYIPSPLKNPDVVFVTRRSPGFAAGGKLSDPTPLPIFNVKPSLPYFSYVLSHYHVRFISSSISYSSFGYSVVGALHTNQSINPWQLCFLLNLNKARNIIARNKRITK